MKHFTFLDTAISLELDGPSDWSAKLEEYLYGVMSDAKKLGDRMEKQIEKDTFQANLKNLIAVGLYQSEDEILQDALSCLLKSNPEYKLKIAMYRYQTEEISVGKAAEIAGVSMETMKRYLVKNAVMPRFAPENIEEARKDYQTIRRFLDERKRDSK